LDRVQATTTPLSRIAMTTSRVGNVPNQDRGRRRPSVRAFNALGIAALSASAAVLVLSLYGDGWGLSPAETLWLGLAFVLLFMLGVIWIGYARDSSRNLTLRIANPRAYVGQIAIERGAFAQIKLLQEALGHNRQRLLLERNLTLVVDAESIRFYRGGQRAALILQMPVGLLVRVTPLRRVTIAGMATIQRVRVEFRVADAFYVLVFAFSRERLLPGVLHDDAVGSELEALRAATRSPQN
jgi:hypothetical protein